MRSSYDRVAGEYAERIFDELKDKPLDRALLARFTEETRGLGPVCDLGCGPGHVARYLHGLGADVFGIDLSAGMVEQARRLNPEIDFREGDTLSLDVDDEAWGGIVAFYSIIHIPPDELLHALRELWRVLRGGGVLLLSFHVGEEIVHLDEWWGEEVSVDFYFFRPGEVVDCLAAAGFEVEEVVQRPPYEGVEHQSERAYVLARKPAVRSANDWRNEFFVRRWDATALEGNPTRLEQLDILLAVLEGEYRPGEAILDVGFGFRRPQGPTRPSRIRAVTILTQEVFGMIKIRSSWPFGGVGLVVVAIALLAAPEQIEGPVLVPISPGHALSVLDSVALIPLLTGLVWLYWGVWLRRYRLYGVVRASPGKGSLGVFATGLGVGLLVASAFSTFWWWWAIGATLFLAMTIAAVVVAARGW